MKSRQSGLTPRYRGSNECSTCYLCPRLWCGSGLAAARTGGPCITFDDGYADNVTLALPILQKHCLHATFFIATAYLNGGRMFNDTVIEAIRRNRGDKINLAALGLGRHDVASPQARINAINKILPKVKYLPVGQWEESVAELARMLSDIPLPDDLMITTAQLKALHTAGMEIGGHTSHHPDTC